MRHSVDGHDGYFTLEYQGRFTQEWCDGSGKSVSTDRVWLGRSLTGNHWTFLLFLLDRSHVCTDVTDINSTYCRHFLQPKIFLSLRTLSVSHFVSVHWYVGVFHSSFSHGPVEVTPHERSTNKVRQYFCQSKGQESKVFRRERCFYLKDKIKFGWTHSIQGIFRLLRTTSIFN